MLRRTGYRLRLAIGGRDMEAGAVSVRLHQGGPQGAKPKAEVVGGYSGFNSREERINYR